MYTQSQTLIRITSKTRKKLIRGFGIAAVILTLVFTLYAGYHYYNGYIEHNFQGVLIQEDGTEREANFSLLLRRSDLFWSRRNERYAFLYGKLQVEFEYDPSIYNYYISNECALVIRPEGGFAFYNEESPYGFLWAKRYTLPGKMKPRQEENVSIFFDSLTSPKNIVVNSERGYQFYSLPIDQSFHDLVAAQRPAPCGGTYE